MPDELRPDDLRDLWREEPREAARMPLEAVRQRARQFEAGTRRGFRIAGLMMVGAAAGYAWFLYLFPGMLARLGSTLTLAGYLYCAFQFRKRGAVGSILSEAPAATCQAYQQELERLRDFSFVSRLMLPFLPGPALLLIALLAPEAGFPKAAVVTAAIVAPPFAVAVPLIQRKRVTLEREIRSLDALMQ